MGYFAVLRSADADHFSVPRCHINIWVFSGLFPGRRLLYFDVGVEIKAGPGGQITSFQLLLPFRVEDGFKVDLFQKCEDLSRKIIAQDTAELIFGGPVDLTCNANGCTLTPRRADPLSVG